MPARSRLFASAVVAVVALVGVACSSDDDGGAAPEVTTPVVPSSTGDECADPTGDLSADTKAQVGSGTDPAGIDITAASATLEGDRLDIAFETAGPIDETPGASFVVAQGMAGDALAFEIRAVRDDASSAWAITVITWSGAEQRRSVVTQPTVAGNRISWSVPSGDLPPLANYLTFGATARTPTGVVFDDCTSLTSAPTVGGG